MIRKGRLFTPGPTQLLPAAQLAMAGATMHHRTAEFRALFKQSAGRFEDIRGYTQRRGDVYRLWYRRNGGRGFFQT